MQAAGMQGCRGVGSLSLTVMMTWPNGGGDVGTQVFFYAGFKQEYRAQVQKKVDAAIASWRCVIHASPQQLDGWWLVGVRDNGMAWRRA